MVSTHDLLAALNIVGLESETAAVFRPIGPVACEFTNRFPALAERQVDLAVEFPFLGTFLEDVEDAWRAGSTPVLRSGTWCQPDEDGSPCELEATAIRNGERKILLLEFLGTDFQRLQGILQSAREQRLAFENLEQLRGELERRVAERTADLVAANRRLRLEIERRRQANDQLLEYQEHLRELADRLTFTEERERRRIANHIHDRIGQGLALVKINLGILGKEIGSHSARPKVAAICKSVEAAIADSRSLTFELGSPILYELGLESALQSLVMRLAEDHRIRATFRDDGERKDLDHEHRVVLYQSVRELLHNVVKHAVAESVFVVARREGDEIEIVVEDSGKGFDAASQEFRVTESGGFGLFNMRERLDHLGGRCEIHSKPGAGTRVVLSSPLSKSSEESVPP